MPQSSVDSEKHCWVADEVRTRQMANRYPAAQTAKKHGDGFERSQQLIVTPWSGQFFSLVAPQTWSWELGEVHDGVAKRHMCDGGGEVGWL